MLQIINISQARNNLSKLVKEVKETKKPVVIVKDSLPSVVVYPYDEVQRLEEEKERLWKLRFDRAIKESREQFRKWLKKSCLIFHF